MCVTLGNSEVLYEDNSLNPSTWSLTALVASKVYHRRVDLGESLQFALGAGDWFEVQQVGTIGTDCKFVETVVCD